jgi:SAM-dependent methyltransferase
VVVDGEERREALPVTARRDTAAAFEATKRQKLDRIEPLLRCPRLDGDGACGGRLVATGAVRTCERCEAQYTRDADGFTMLADELVELAGVVETDNVSQNPYDEVALELVAEGGLVLDAGAGLRPDYHDNVVNVDVVGYPTTDVRAVGERLPFADASFDAAISYAVLEHVRDPFACAAEIRRVVRPGGRLVVGVLFLFPYHGFPHHYYNMTMQGLTELFRPDFDIDRAWVPDSGLPIYMLTYILDRWVASLPEPIAERFRAMSVDELRGPAAAHLDQPYVRALSDDVNAELAATVHIVATKRGPEAGPPGRS